jgi:hypothetical protein
LEETMTSNTLPAPATRSRSGRPPAPVVTASVLTIVLSLFSGYGAVYFTGLEGWDAAGVTFVTTFEGIVVFAITCAVALLRGSDYGRVGLIAWGVFEVAFTVMKLVTIQELQAIPFGVVSLVILGLVLHPRTRAYTG